MKTLIQVTESDMAHGERLSPCGCPIALAASRVFGATARVEVTFILVGGLKIRLPEEASRWIERFDDCKATPLISFEVEAAVLERSVA